MKFLSKPFPMITAAAMITACAALQTATAAVPFYSPGVKVSLQLENITTLDATKQYIAALLPRWRLQQNGGAIASATVGTTQIDVVDAAGHRAVLPLNPAPDAHDIKVTYTSPTAPTLHIGEHTLVPTSQLNPRDFRLLADAINTVRLSEQVDW
jgi:hypothetical protein